MTQMLFPSFILAGSPRGLFVSDFVKDNKKELGNDKQLFPSFILAGSPHGHIVSKFVKIIKKELGDRVVTENIS
ncbi:MAG: hypothetical protein IJ330_03735 [Oscillospiraceae bacterium]|nr:hypothetical protein [Oscillospiraceae bacterium]